MKKIIKEGHEITRFTLPRAEAIQYMEEKGEPFKVELIQDLPEDAEISFYDQGGFVDLSRVPDDIECFGVCRGDDIQLAVALNLSPQIHQLTIDSCGGNPDWIFVITGKKRQNFLNCSSTSLS